MSWTTRLAIAVAVIALVFLGVTPAAMAHTGGRVVLHVSDFHAEPAGDGAWTVHVALVDSDSAAPAAGFAVTVTGTDPGGTVAGPVPMEDPAGNGRYEAVLRGAAGKWSIKVDAESRPGGEAAVPFSRVWDVELGGGPSTPAVDPSEETHPGHGDSSALAVRVANEGPRGASEFYVPVTATVIHQATGAPATEGYDVFAWARNEQGEKTEFFPAIEQLGPNQPGGTYQAYVIVPHGGAWTLMVTVNEQRSGQTLAEAGIPADVAAGVLASTTGVADPLDRYGTAASSPGADPLRAGMLWVHTLVAVAWAMAVGLLAVMATPKGRRLLSDRGSTLLDGRLPALIRAARWTTVLVVLTGVYNMVNSLAYKLPGSGAQLREVLRLPYGDAYFGALGVKLAVYGAMMAASVPLVRAARRQADSWGAGDDIPVSASVRQQPARSPWGAPAEGGVAVKERVSAPPVVAEEPKAARVLLGGLALGGLIITLAVTLLKYFHVLIEAARAA